MFIHTHKKDNCLEEEVRRILQREQIKICNKERLLLRNGWATKSKYASLIG